MESGIDPGQDYYTQDYYSCDHGCVFRSTPHNHALLRQNAAADVTIAPSPRAALVLV